MDFHITVSKIIYTQAYCTLAYIYITYIVRLYVLQI